MMCFLGVMGICRSWYSNLNAPFEQITLEISNAALGVQNPFMGKVDLHAHEFVNEEPKPTWYLLKRQSAEQHVSGDLFLKIVLVSHPKWATSLRGGYRLFRRLYGPAIEDLSEAIKEFHDAPDQLFELLEFRCTAYMGTKNYDAAKNDVMAMIGLKKTHPSCFYFLGRVALALEDYEQATLAFTQGLEANPGNPRLLHALTNLKKNAQSQSIKKTLDDASKALKARQPDQAADIITNTLIKSDPNQPLYYWYRSLTRIAAGRYDLADKDIKTCCEKNPNWPRQSPTKQGKMSKRGRINPASKERYFYLQDRFLFYYKNNKAKEYQGFIIIHGATIDLPSQKKDIFIRSISGDRIFNLTAASVADAAEWANALRAAARLPLTLPTEETLPSLSAAVAAKATSSTSDSLAAPSSMMIAKSPSNAMSPSPSPSSFSGTSLTTNTPLVHNQVVVSGLSYEGWLYKAGEINTRFKKRWFVLRSEILYYFKGKPEAKDDVYSGVKGFIPITSYMIQVVPNPEFAFELLPHAPGGRSYLLHAGTNDERNRWLEEIGIELRRAQATLSTKESERASLEVSTDEDEAMLSDSHTPRRAHKEAPEVRLFTPGRDSPTPPPAESTAITDLDGISTSTTRTRPTRYYNYNNDDSVNAGIISERRRSSISRRSYDPSDSEDEYTPLVRDYSYYNSQTPEPTQSDSKGGCCSCSVM